MLSLIPRQRQHNEWEKHMSQKRWSFLQAQQSIIGYPLCLRHANIHTVLFPFMRPVCLHFMTLLQLSNGKLSLSFFVEQNTFWITVDLIHKFLTGYASFCYWHFSSPKGNLKIFRSLSFFFLEDGRTLWQWSVKSKITLESVIMQMSNSPKMVCVWGAFSTGCLR